MNEQVLIDLIGDTIFLVFLIGAPLLGAALVIGLAVSVFQVVTSIQDMTLTFVPRMVGICLLTLVLMPWIISRIVSFTTELFGRFALYAQ
jgi:flagellar biosynthesis protein FliQ